MKIITFFTLLLLSCTGYTQINSFFPVWDSETTNWYFLDSEGNKTVDVEAKNLKIIHPVFEGRALAFDSISQKYGYLGENGKWIILPTFDQAHDFTDGFAVVSNTCTKKCNKNTDGIISDETSSAIDTNGTLIFSDQSQNQELAERWFLKRHLQNGIFEIYTAYSVGELGYLINKETTKISDRYNTISSGSADYITQLNAFHVQGKFIDSTGKVLLDFSNHGTCYSDFGSGYGWAEYVIEADYSTIYTLLDINGKVIEQFHPKTEEYQFPSNVKNGEFLFGGEGNEHLYSIQSKTNIACESKCISDFKALETGLKKNLLILEESTEDYYYGNEYKPKISCTYCALILPNGIKIYLDGHQEE